MEAKDRVLSHLNRPLSVYCLPRSVRCEGQIIRSDTDSVTVLSMKLE